MFLVMNQYEYVIAYYENQTQGTGYLHFTKQNKEGPEE